MSIKSGKGQAGEDIFPFKITCRKCGSREIDLHFYPGEIKILTLEFYEKETSASSNINDRDAHAYLTIKCRRCNTVRNFGFDTAVSQDENGNV